MFDKLNVKKILTALALTVIAVISLTAFSACEKVTPNPDDYVNGQGNTIKAHLDCLNGSYRDYRLKPGSVIPEPGVTPTTEAPIKEGYVFMGFYEGTVSDNTVIYGAKWDFSTKVNQNVNLYAKWQIQFKIKINFLVDGVLKNEFTVMNVSKNMPAVTGIVEPIYAKHTFVELFSDEQGKTPLNVSSSNPFTHGCSEQAPVREIYARFIEGKWTLVRKASDMTTISSGSNLYLMDDIDFAERNDAETGITRISLPSMFSGKINGNGHAISNIKFVRVGEKTAGKNSFGMFATLFEATIENVIFRNCSIGAVVSRQEIEYFYGFLAGKSENTVLSNITLDNCTIDEMKFSFLGELPDADKVAAEIAKVTDGVLVGEGNDYLPDVI